MDHMMYRKLLVVLAAYAAPVEVARPWSKGLIQSTMAGAKGTKRSNRPKSLLDISKPGGESIW
jgi:hypothetical protein